MDVTNNPEGEVIEELERYSDCMNITIVRPPQLPPGLEDSLFKCFSKRFTKRNLIVTSATQLVNDHHFHQHGQQHILEEQGCAHFVMHKMGACANGTNQQLLLETAWADRSQGLPAITTHAQSVGHKSGKAKYANPY